MRFLLFVGALALLTACSDHPGYESLDGDVLYKLESFGHGEGQVQDAEAIEISLFFAQKDAGKEEYAAPHQLQLPFDFPMHPSVWEKLKIAVEGDSMSFFLPGDSVWAYAPYPTWIGGPLKEASKVHMTITVHKVLDQRSFFLNAIEEVQLGRRDEYDLLSLCLQGKHDRFQKIGLEREVYLAVDAVNTKPLLYSGDPVDVDILGMLPSGDVFTDSRKSQTTLHFVVGDPDQVIPGIDLALRYMSYEEKVRVILPSWEAFGEEGAGLVPPRTPVIFEIEARRPSAEP